MTQRTNHRQTARTEQPLVPAFLRVVEPRISLVLVLVLVLLITSGGAG